VFLIILYEKNMLNIRIVLVADFMCLYFLVFIKKNMFIF